MKAAVLEAISTVDIKEVPDPVLPKVGGLVVTVETCAVCATDVKMYRHGYASAKLPLIPGHELAGTILAVGDEVTGYRVGQRVVMAPNIPCGRCYYCQRGMQTACDNLLTIGVQVDGGFAERVLIPPQAVLQGCVLTIPDHLSFQEAALVDIASCVANACELSGIKAGDTVVVIGAGPAGCLSVELARGFGAGKTILVDVSRQRLEQAEFTGASIMLDASAGDPVPLVRAETGGRGADVVIVACGSGVAQEQALTMAAKRGNINFFGGLPKSKPFIQFDSNLIHYTEASVVGTHGGAVRHCQLALDSIAAGRIKAGEYISAVFGLSEFVKAIEAAESMAGLKVFIDPSR